MNHYKIQLKLDGAVVHEARELLSGTELERYDRANREFATAYARNEMAQLLEFDWQLIPPRLHA